MPGELIDSEAIFAPLAEFRRVGLAVSGGPDSLALMLLASEFAARHGAHDRFTVYSVDHGLRPEAAGEVAYVTEAARQLGFAARALRWQGAKPATGIQQAARTARYGLIADAMAADGTQILVTAHHLADQAETVLMRLAHGSGVEGLRGMDYLAEIDRVDGEAVVRPMPGSELGRQQHQRQTVGPAGNGKPDAPEFGERGEDRLAVDQLTGHFAFCASSSRRCVNAGLSCG